jgi:hypothetical protein
MEYGKEKFRSQLEAVMRRWVEGEADVVTSPIWKEQRRVIRFPNQNLTSASVDERDC